MHVLVTGASSGFGLDLVRALTSRGHSAVAALREMSGRNSKIASELASENIDVVDMDVTDDRSVQEAVRSAISMCGHIDVVVNNAGIGVNGPTEAATVDDLRLQFETNVYGPHRVNRAVLPHMRERRSGLLVAISSGAGRLGFPNGGVYSASKWALEAMSQSMRYELASFGIDSVIVEPGPFETKIMENSRTVSDVAVVAAYEAEPVPRGSAVERKDPKEVVDAIVALIETPRGQRPLRVVVHPTLQAELEAINAASNVAAAKLLSKLPGRGTNGV